MDRPPFWQHKPLTELDESEWEALCDGCGKCCLAKIEDIDSGEIVFTRVACHLLDTQRCRCKAYGQRLQKVADCLRLSMDNIDAVDWLPATCAYRLRHEGKPLHSWHPLVSGSTQSVREAGVSVSGRVISEQYVHPDSLEEHVVHWV
ncbi:MAG: YcgN family cysteine cluster protein [Gammaproteobacteria bacterium]|nr:MAG: YcgN family cysteine cluster protein [Gammaproteobacteria bacterium]RLA47995.1 MAG: YcgN family cysteine cluster protein [Gammaproteobacteria bacterium]